MKRALSLCASLVVIALAVPVVHADVKTREKTTFEFGGFLGGVARTFGGRAAREGTESTVAIKGNRMASTTEQTTEIVDLSEERIYSVDNRRREYRVKTFAELRAEFEKAKADAEKQAQKAGTNDGQQAGAELEFDVNVQETGQHQTLAGHQTREVVLTLTGRQKGRTLEDGGGFVMTNTMWLAPRVAALNELVDFQMRYIRAVYGENFLADMQQMAALMAMYPSFGEMTSRMQEEGKKLDGTPLSTKMVFEVVRSAEQMQQQAQAANEGSSGGGLGGMLGRRLMGNRGQPEPRSVMMTTTTETLAIETTVSDADVSIPSNYRERR